MAPNFVRKPDREESVHQDFDWDLSSIAASLPLKYEYDGPPTSDASG